MNKKSFFIYFVIIFLLGIIIKYLYYNSSEKMNSRETYLVAHALGGIDEKSYTNSLEALEYNYEKGYRTFEVDIAITSDNKLVARHGWEEDLAKWYNQDLLPSEKNKPLSLNRFKELKIFSKYTPLSFKDIVEFMSKHKDMYLVTDTKSMDGSEVKKQFKLIVSECNSVDRSVLERIMPQIYNEQMLSLVKSEYEFKNIIYTIYQINDPADKIIKFMLNNNINIVTMPLIRVSPKFINDLNNNNIRSYVHTVNDVNEMKKLKKMGVCGFYTDYITQDQLN